MKKIKDDKFQNCQSKQKYKADQKGFEEQLAQCVLSINTFFLCISRAGCQWARLMNKDF